MYFLSICAVVRVFVRAFVRVLIFVFHIDIYINAQTHLFFLSYVCRNLALKSVFLFFYYGVCFLVRLCEFAIN